MSQAFNKSTMPPARIYIRNNGTLGSACDAIADTGHSIAEDSGKFTVWSVHDEDRCICSDVSRPDAEWAIAADWRAR